MSSPDSPHETPATSLSPGPQLLPQIPARVIVKPVTKLAIKYTQKNGIVKKTTWGRKALTITARGRHIVTVLYPWQVKREESAAEAVIKQELEASD